MATKNSTAKKSTVTKKGKITEEDIRKKAEEIYKERMLKGIHGDHVSDWLKAEKELKKLQ